MKITSMGLFERLIIFLEILINGFFILFYTAYKAEKIVLSFGLQLVQQLLEISLWLVPIVLFLNLMWKLFSAKSFEDFLRENVFSLIVFVPIVITFGDIEFLYWLSAVHLFSTIVSSFDKEEHITEEFIVPSGLRTGLFPGLKLSPAQLVLVTWTGTILLGCLVLMLPVSAATGKSVEFIDALFVSASAVSTTGLSTISLQDNLSIFGQIAIMVLIQIGGIGFMTMSSAFLMVTGKSFAIKEQVLLQDILDATAISELYEMVLDVVRYTFVIEFVGMLVLTYGFYVEGFDLSESLWLGCFHSISAFCTAGFGLFNTSMEAFATNSYISWGCTVLAILGGLGFLVLKEVTLVIQKKVRLDMISMHSKVILVTSFFLYSLGTLIVFMGEFTNSLEGLSLYDEIHIALFQFASTLSTSGFNSLPMNSLQPHTLYLMLIMMFIGCSPGSTGGGIKITTFAILLQSIKTTLYGKGEVEFFNRSIAPNMVIRATALTIVSLIIIAISIFIIMAGEPNFTFYQLSFEVFSAFGTVGLSMGITSSLSIFGKLVITAVMFVGRIGPLTLVLALAERSSEDSSGRYPQGKIMIG